MDLVLPYKAFSNANGGFETGSRLVFAVSLAAEEAFEQFGALVVHYALDHFCTMVHPGVTQHFEYADNCPALGVRCAKDHFRNTSI